MVGVRTPTLNSRFSNELSFLTPSAAPRGFRYQLGQLYEIPKMTESRDLPIDDSVFLLQMSVSVREAGFILGFQPSSPLPDDTRLIQRRGVLILRGALSSKRKVDSAYARQLRAAQHINNACGADSASHHHRRRRVIRNLSDQTSAFAQRMRS